MSSQLEDKGLVINTITDPFNIQVSCHGWSPELQRDVLLPFIRVILFVHAGGSIGKTLEKTCNTPEELWKFLQDLTADSRKVLKEDFGYIGPEKKVAITGIPLNLNDLFK